MPEQTRIVALGPDIGSVLTADSLIIQAGNTERLVPTKFDQTEENGSAGTSQAENEATIIMRNVLYKQDLRFFTVFPRASTGPDIFVKILLTNVR